MFGPTLRRRMALNICPELIADIRVSPDAEVAPLSAFGQQDLSIEPKAWERVRTQEQAQAYLAAASEEELRAMAERLLAGHPVSHAEAVPQRLIALALLASEELWRRVIGATGEAKHCGYRWHPQADRRGSRT